MPFQLKKKKENPSPISINNAYIYIYNLQNINPCSMLSRSNQIPSSDTFIKRKEHIILYYLLSYVGNFQEFIVKISFGKWSIFID
jgi:hypothetical protein